MLQLLSRSMGLQPAGYVTCCSHCQVLQPTGIAGAHVSHDRTSHKVRNQSLKHVRKIAQLKQLCDTHICTWHPPAYRVHKLCTL